MADSDSKLPPPSEATGSSADEGCEKLIFCFGKFGLAKDGIPIISQPSRTSDSLVGKIHNDTSLIIENHQSRIQNLSALAWNNPSDKCYPVSFPAGRNIMDDYGRNLNPVEGRQFFDGQWSQIMNSNTASPTYFPRQVPENFGLQPEIDLQMMARTRYGSEKLQEFLEEGDYGLTQEILNAVLGSIFELMVDDNGSHVFGKLVEKCCDYQLASIVSKAYQEPYTFIQVAFTEKGSKSIQRLIRRLKRSPIVEIIARILSRGSYKLLTHKTGSHVIRQCFVNLRKETKLVFYPAIASHLLPLATDPVGCISLNNFVDSMTSPQREVIINSLAQHSLFLSNDPSGSYVVQHLLNLYNKQATESVLWALKGHFVELAQKQGGSHIVEKCIRSSEIGLNLVISEILGNEKALFRLAQDQFGNYVIQTALKHSKMTGDRNLYPRLLNAFMPYYPYLLGNTHGRHVADLIKDDLGLKEEKSNE